MPTEKARGVRSVRKKRKREANLEADSSAKDEEEANSCIPVAKKVNTFNVSNESVHLLEMLAYALRA